MKTKLIVVEGLPGSGKSTLAAKIAEALERKGEKVVCVDEGEPDHPADYADYDFPDFETERDLILKRWREFVDSADEYTVYVFNCVFLQNPMCETMMRFGLEEENSKRYIQEISDVIRPLNPMIVYIDLPDVKATVDSVREERGEDWVNAVVDYHTKQGYGSQNHLNGYDGYIRCLEERKRRELNILPELGLDYRIVDRDVNVDNLVAD